MNDLTICQECHENPAVYGDGLTWSRCSACQLKFSKEQPESPSQPENPNEEGFKHTIIPNLTSIILPVFMTNYSLFHYTGNCIGSVREHTNPDSYELVVVDNGSPIQPPEPNSYYADKLVKNEQNLGVTKAWNQGIRVSQGEFIVLLNNDVQVFQDWLEDMKKGLIEEGFDLVMAHPMYSLTEPFARAIESRQIREKALSSKDKYSTFKDFSCVMFRRSLLDEIGMFDEDFFNYCSDSDFFIRMEEVGKKWACCETVPTSHISDATGYSIAETPEIMNKDKEVYKNKWETKKVESKTVVPDGLLVRSNRTGDAIFLIKNDLRHKIKNPETLRALGFDFGQEQTVPEIKLKDGEEITMENYTKYA